MSKTAFEMVMDDRKDLVNFIVNRMEEYGENWKKGWDTSSLSAFNPISVTKYKGQNILKTFKASIENEYKDPRYMTFNQAKSKGYSIKAGAKGVLLEKWIFDKEEKYIDENGEEQKRKVHLDKPIASYFKVFNGSDIQGIEPFKLEKIDDPNKIFEIADNFIKSSKVPVKEIVSDKAFYDVNKNEIVIPLRESFSSPEKFLGTLAHEVIHSTGKELERNVENNFGTKDYAKEELVAELGSLFLQSKLEIPLETEHINNSAAYLNSWIKKLKNDPNELFRAASLAEQATELAFSRYLEITKDISNEKEKNEIPVKNQKENEYWYIEYNETSKDIKNYSNSKLNKELLEELKQLDNKKWYQKENGCYKFYFEHVKNGEIIDKVRIDIGDNDIEAFKYLENKLNELKKSKTKEEKLEKKETTKKWNIKKDKDLER